MKQLLFIFIIPFLSFGQCSEGEYPISISTTTAEWAYEMNWGLWDYNSWMEGEIEAENALLFFQGTDDYQTVNFDDCLPSYGCYMIAAYDSYGDGWNGGTLLVNINSAKEPQVYEMEDGEWEYWTFEVNSKSCNWEIPGCTDPNAANYNNQATIDNESCITPLFFDWDNQQREYFLYIPENLPENAPLVFALHGYWGEGSDMLGLFEEQADQYGFVVCYPSGLQDNFGTNHWNANFNELMTTIDDIGFLSNLASTLQEDYNLSPEKTFSCGMSNGGFMSWTLACNAPETFKAIASVTGTMSGPDWETCNPPELVPVMQISGTADNVVPMDGSMQYLDEGWGGAPDIYSVMNYWSDLHGCTQNETTNFNFDYSTNLTIYTMCDNTNAFVDETLLVTELRLYVANNMGHTWPSFADEEIWDFFMKIGDYNSNINDEYFSNDLLKVIDLLGRETTTNKGLQLEVYIDGSVEKKYIIK